MAQLTNFISDCPCPIIFGVDDGHSLAHALCIKFSTHSCHRLFGLKHCFRYKVASNLTELSQTAMNEAGKMVISKVIPVSLFMCTPCHLISIACFHDSSTKDKYFCYLHFNSRQRLPFLFYHKFTYALHAPEQLDWPIV